VLWAEEIKVLFSSLNGTFLPVILSRLWAQPGWEVGVEGPWWWRALSHLTWKVLFSLGGRGDHLAMLRGIRFCYAGVRRCWGTLAGQLVEWICWGRNNWEWRVRFGKLNSQEHMSSKQERSGVCEPSAKLRKGKM
jgi:hypothetical protein